jgi:enamine deaminase RidA (YjgF/YER057c/UK114 family)
VKKSLWDEDCATFWAQRKKESRLHRNGHRPALPVQYRGKTRMKSFLVGLLLWLTVGAQAQVGAAVPSQESPAFHGAPSSVDAGDYIYISGQGPRGTDGALPATFPAQVRQALNNLKSVVESAGLTMDHVVYTTVYLTDISEYQEMNSAFGGYFGKIPPARAVLGVAALPDPPIQINAVAVRSLLDRRAIYPPGYKSDEPFSPGILTHDRLFVSAMPENPAGGRISDDPATQVDFALDRVKAVVEAAGLDLRHMVFVNPYLTVHIPMRVMNEHYARRFEFGNTPARATIEVSSLPGGAGVEFTGVAVRDLERREAVRPKNMPPSPTASPCVFAGDTLYCSAKSGFIPGPNGGVYASTTPIQLRQTMRNQLDNLEEADMNFDQVVSTTVYLDNLADTQAFDEVYAKYFRGMPPARTTIQQIVPAERNPDKEEHYPDLEQVSLIAVRNRPRH